MNEIVLNLSVTGGNQLSVSKEGSQLLARATFGSIQHDSAVVNGSLAPVDYDLKIAGRLNGSGHQFCDQLARYPLIITLNEVFAKDKKQKEEKIIPHAAFTVDLISFLSGTKRIERSFSAPSSEVPNLTVEFKVQIEIEKTFPIAFLSEEYRILTIRLLNAGNIPESWIGNNFTATLPVPKENNETIGVNFLGKSENSQSTNDIHLHWQDNTASFPKDEIFEHTAEELQNGDKIKAVRQGPQICWNTERRILMSRADSEIFQSRIAKFAKYLPIEIARAREPEGAKKGKGKQDQDNDLQNHGVALVNLSPLLYPGVSAVKGVFPIQGYTDHILASSGYSTSVAEELNRCGSNLNIDQRIRSAKAKPSNTSDISTEKKSTHPHPDALPYNEMQTSLYFEFELSRPFVERRKFSELVSNLRSIIPKREPIPRKKFGAEASVNEFHSVIAEIGRKVLEDIRNFRKIPSGDENSFHDSLMYKMNKTGKYNDYHEQLKYSVIRIVREKYLKTQNFASDEEFKTFLEVLYVFLVKEMHKSLNHTVVQDAPQEPEKVATLEELENAAMFSEKMEDYEKANYLWTELLARDDSSPFAWRGLARTALMVGDIDRTHEALQQAVSLSQADPWTMILAAMISKQRGDLYQTKVLLSRSAANPESEDQTVLEENPVNPVERAIAFILLGKIYEEELSQELAQFSNIEATRMAKHVKVTEPGQGIYLLAAEMFERSSLRGFSQQMLASYIASLPVTTELPGRALLLKSKLEMQNYDNEQALQTITEASKVDHSNSSVWAQMGRIYLKIGEIENAKEAFSRSVSYENQPDDPVVVFIRLAKILENENDFNQARRYYLMACEVCPTATGWLGVGMCSLRLNELVEAEDALAEANLLDPRNAQVWGYLSLLCLKTQRKLEAEQSFKFASKLNLDDKSLLDEIKNLQIEVGFGDPSY